MAKPVLFSSSSWNSPNVKFRFDVAGEVDDTGAAAAVAGVVACVLLAFDPHAAQANATTNVVANFISNLYHTFLRVLPSAARHA